jgi:NAD(P)-dependent dehydrogenase (short-subunit alcohol dehydrogenase family)
MMDTTNRVTVITGAGRGLGRDIAKAALEAGHKVVATGRNPGRVEKALGTSDNLLVVKLNVTNAAEPRPPYGRPSSASVASTCW